MLGKLDPSAAIETKPMRDALLFAFLPSRAGAALLGGIGILGLLLATVGLYGVLVYAVARRIREIGIRMALGAAPTAILKMIFRDSFALVAIGMTVGLAIAAPATRPPGNVPGPRPKRHRPHRIRIRNRRPLDRRTGGHHRPSLARPPRRPHDCPPLRVTRRVAALCHGFPTATITACVLLFFAACPSPSPIMRLVNQQCTTMA